MLQVDSVQQAAVFASQTPLDGATIAKYVDALPTFSGKRIDGTKAVTVDMREFQQKILPASVYSSLARPYKNGTYLWGYKVNNAGPAWPAYTIESKVKTSTKITYTNSLTLLTLPLPVLHNYLSVDQSIHWADPLGTTARNNCTEGAPLALPCKFPYLGPIAVVPHLHGAEVASAYDGHPDSWFTPGQLLKGPGYVSNKYTYVNTQEATTLWFHDHALGTTRLNVYSGLAGMYLLRDTRDTGASNNPLSLPAGGYEVEMLVADRQFDTNGQLLFPDGTPADNPTGLNGPPPNPEVHPFWNPEFFGDVITVNGKSWPYLRVEPRRYRIRLVNASNARFYELQLQRDTDASAGPALWQIGSDGGLLDTPAKLNDPAHPNSQKLIIGPGERADVIIDFAGKANQKFILVNTANGPYPDGDPVDPNTSGQVMQFRVDLSLKGTDTSYNPATSATPLRASPIVNIKPTVSDPPDGLRQLTLVEVEGAEGPEMVLLNNSHWDGLISGTENPISGSTSNGDGIYATENPRVGSTEIWEIANLSEDAHPIHLHLIQFQLIDRQAFFRDEYRAEWDAQFPGGTFRGFTYPPGTYIPGYGPPLSYATQNADGAVGGNVDFGAWLDGDSIPADLTEAGWKDTIKMLPFQITRIAVRWAPQKYAVNQVAPGQNKFTFNPSTGGPGYVWHCHILDHEDNEMMRPYLVAP